MFRLVYHIHILKNMNFFKFIFYNFFCNKVKRHGKGCILPMRGAVISLGESSQIELYDNHFLVNTNKPSGSRTEAYVIMRSGARLVVRGTTSLNYGATIEIHENAIVEIGGAYINTGAVILAAKHINIGQGVLISRHVFIYDSDHHPIYNEKGEIANPARDVVIGDHVWIGLKCIVLRGSNIGEGAMVAAGSVVGGKIKPGVLAQGNPARGYSSVIWSASPKQDAETAEK
ncbi:acyltransferase [Cloacibacillus sp. An23]|uniref:acyltransferase n=1 Tax=Cloacibacillus sp. An23 TaxID=1965591 RepID=UPI0011777498|nr:acyltransferase [Cloacibacillus sp. An23]